MDCTVHRLAFVLIVGSLLAPARAEEFRHHTAPGGTYQLDVPAAWKDAKSKAVSLSLIDDGAPGHQSMLSVALVTPKEPMNEFAEAFRKGLESRVSGIHAPGIQGGSSRLRSRSASRSGAAFQGHDVCAVSRLAMS